MTMAQFSRDDILLYQGREEGRAEGREEGREEGLRIGELRGAVRTYQKVGVPYETAREYIMEEFRVDAAEAEEFMRTYWKR